VTGPGAGEGAAAGAGTRLTPPRGPVVIDGGDRACVRLLLELRARICGLPAGTVIHLIASDPAAPLDLPAWCHLTGHAYLGPVPAARPTYAMRTGRHRRGFPLAAPRLTRIPAEPSAWLNSRAGQRPVASSRRDTGARKGRVLSGRDFRQGP
jgi:tRNA 2-thiouridine synthesizing protein A